MTEINIKKKSGKEPASKRDFDLEMLYVECSRCGRPLIWEKGTTTFLIRYSGIEKTLDSDWLMLSKGCPTCSPDQNEFVLTLAGPEDNRLSLLCKKLRSN